MGINARISDKLALSVSQEGQKAQKAWVLGTWRVWVVQFWVLMP